MTKDTLLVHPETKNNVLLAKQTSIFESHVTFNLNSMHSHLCNYAIFVGWVFFGAALSKPTSKAKYTFYCLKFVLPDKLICYSFFLGSVIADSYSTTGQYYPV